MAEARTVTTFADISAFVVAGGKSSRMGRDKAFIELEGRSLLQRVLTLAQAVSDKIAIVGDPEKFASFAPVVPDVFVAAGPLGGIHAALQTTTTDLNLVLAVDMPFLDVAFVHYLVEQARTSSEWVLVPSVEGRLQPLCALYQRGFAAIAETALRAGRNKIDALFAQVPTRILDESQWTPLGFSPAIFRNLNTPDDLQQVLKKSE